jgi:CRISPR-associated protein (TIGR03984 family)
MTETADDENTPTPQRSVERCEASVRVEAVSPEALGSAEALRAWLEEAAAEQGARWLLGYDDDGVLWGRFDAGHGLVTARAAVRRRKGAQAAARFAELRPVTLREVNLFGRACEVKLWHSDTGGWRARYIDESAADGGGERSYAHYFDEDHLLIGSYGEKIDDGFTLVWEGRNYRHLHAVPAALPLRDDEHLTAENQPRLRVRTYLTEGPWYEPDLQRLAGLVDARDDDLNAPGTRTASAAASAHS